MSDLIDRQVAIKAMSVLNDSICGQQAIDALCELPSAQRWIPVSERLPGYGEQVVVNFRNEQIGRNRIGVSYCYVQKEGFFSEIPFEYKVVAWMPLPEPYKEGQDDRT